MISPFSSHRISSKFLSIGPALHDKNKQTNNAQGLLRIAKMISQYSSSSMQKRGKKTNRTNGSQNRTVGSKSGLTVQKCGLPVRYSEPTIH